MHKSLSRGMCLLLLAAAAAPALLAQDSRSRREELERIFQNADEQTRPSTPSDLGFSKEAEAFKPAKPDTVKDWLFDAGGWVRGTFSTFDTQLGFDRTLWDYDLRAWGEVSYKEYQRVYARFRSFYTDYNTGDQPSGRPTDWQRLRGDQIFYEAQLARMAGMNASTDLDLTLGRQFFFMGKGLALANVLDGARFNARFSEWSFDLIAARTIHDSPDFDPTVPETDKESDRTFFGGTLSTTAFGQRRFYAYALSQTDQNNYGNAAQKFDYNSLYLGFGSEGSLGIFGGRPSEVGYSAEVMFQSGKSNANAGGEESIMAYGLLADIFWLPGAKLPFKSRFVFGYGFGSGDADRTLQLGTLNGNTPGTKDSALNYFGFANTGYALAPRLTNLHMLKSNFEATLLENSSTWMRSMKLGGFLFHFFKHHTDASISDFTAIRSSGYLGTELDLYADFSLASDLDVGVRYGVFQPGEAFPSKELRHYLSAYFSLSF